MYQALETRLRLKALSSFSPFVLPSSTTLSVSSLHCRWGDGYGAHLEMVGVGRIKVLLMVVLLDVIVVDYLVLNKH